MNQSRIRSLIYICCNGEAMGNMKLSIWLVYHCWSLVFFKNIQVTNVINNVKLLYVNDIQMEFISICIHFLRRYIVRDYGRNKHSLNWKYKLNSLYNWYVVICWHFGRNTDAFMISTKKWNCWWRWLWRIRKEHTICYSVETLCVKWIFVKDILDNREVNNVELLEWIHAYLKIWVANWNIWKQNGNLTCLFERSTFNFEWQRS